MIVLARLEAEHSDMHELLAELDKAQEAITPVLAEGAAISDEHYERMPAGEAHPSYFKGRRVFKIPSIERSMESFGMKPYTFSGSAIATAAGSPNA